MYKLCFYVPKTHLETVKAALFSAGAGRYNAYDRCCWQVLGEGQFRPLENSNPYIGHPMQLQQIAEYKVELVCTDDVIKNAVQCLLASHPYEEPAYEIYKIQAITDL